MLQITYPKLLIRDLLKHWVLVGTNNACKAEALLFL